MKKRNKKNILLIAAAVCFVIFIAGFAYVNDYYRSDESNAVYLESSETVTVSEVKEGLLFDGIGTEKALIFYPGAKVEYTAYAPILRGLAENGMDCFLVKMPVNLAILGQDKAEDIMERYGNYKDWYLAGHSLGGAMAAAYVADNIEDFAGIVLLAAYPTESFIDVKDIDEDEIAMVKENFKVVSIYGSEDKVLNWENFEAGRSFMPVNYYEICLQGGNHAWFGNYGEQDGDGKAVLTHEEQWQQTVDVIISAIEM